MGLGRSSPTNLRRKLNYQIKYCDIDETKRKELEDKILDLELDIEERKERQGVPLSEKKRKRVASHPAEKKQKKTRTNGKKKGETKMSVLCENTDRLLTLLDEIENDDSTSCSSSSEDSLRKSSDDISDLFESIV